MITAKVGEIDRLLGLELRADSTSVPDTSASLTLNKDNFCVNLGAQELSLTSVEFELLSVLLNAPGKIFSRDQLMDRIYADHRVVSERTIDSHVTKLRKRLSELGNADAQGEVAGLFGLLWR